MRIDLLDVGNTRYGDCLLVRQGSRIILIDGAHAGDLASIEQQLEQLLGRSAPFDIDLLVVTHCHSDHIGCLPALVGADTVIPKVALVADEKLGFGRSADGVGPADGVNLTRTQRMLVAGLQEEGYADMPPEELVAALAEDATLEEKYIEMLEHLTQAGCHVVRYGRAPEREVRRIETDFADFGLQVVGPTKDHLVVCADAITAGADAIVQDVLRQNLADDVDALDLASVYRQLAGRHESDAAFAADRPGVGAAKNDQSIVLKVSAGGWSTLLAGDMQFAKAEVPGLDAVMRTLRQTVIDAGPYDFIKTSHHTSYNGVDESLLTAWATTTLYAHTGGKNDAGHPDPGVLELLKRYRDQLKFARTDRNGIITVEKNANVDMTISKGRVNDFTENVQDLPLAPAQVVAGPAAGRGVSRFLSSSSDAVEVLARIPNQKTKVTLTIEIEPADRGAHIAQTTSTGQRVGVGSRLGPDPATLRIGGGRSLPSLVVVTSRAKLARNIGDAQTTAIFEALAHSPSITLVDVPPERTRAEDVAAFVRPRLKPQTAGVLILGGMDVVPALQLDVLDPALRREIDNGTARGQDADDFIVWSDDLYGDRDGDLLPELPVSRIPDGQKADIVIAALQTRSFSAGTRFGVRNLARPFAGNVFTGLPGRGGTLEVSEVFSPNDVTDGAACGAVYYMLHGSDQDATRFWGETSDGATFEAFALRNVPRQTDGSIVFTGCCWGALTMTPRAARARRGMPLRPLSMDSSIALAYLGSGTLAFVGCTGSHYSPQQAPYNYFGKPMHDAFWSHVAAGDPPAKALFAAKKEFATGLPHGQTGAFAQAVELKILRQYTCLGLGW